ncbi:uncharacterized protein LOC141660833 [Apium graveolens]|uniref:uncharacterized protein LOC141660833 n=1 Tax=Apium graveolens TaxID=4045 RepID=UPI003D79AA67
MTDIVPGPNSIGKDINVCLRPLVDELKIFWNTGVKIYDQSLKQNFTMRADIIWIISDYPSMSMISGWSGKGKMGCQVCLGSVQGEGVKELLDGLVFPPPGKTNLKARSVGYGEEHHWTHVPIFYELPYWSSHSLRYSIDIMHTENNVFENIFFTIVNAAKSKDHKKQERIASILGSLKLLDGYSSNISRCYNVEECTFYGFKSHDCHIFLQKLLSLAIRELLSSPIADAITEISNFFQNLCSSVVTKTDLEIMEKSVIKALCLLEMIFPQSWFDSMEHLVVHLAEEIRLAGPAYWKYQDRVMRQRPKTTPQDLDRIVKSRFKTWFKQKVDKDEVEGPRFRDLLEGSVVKVMTFETCQFNGYKFSTKSASGSGMVVKGNLHGNNLDYYGQLQEIIRFIYQGCNYIYLFKYIWFDSVGNGVRIDKNRVITIDMTSNLKSNEIFILASQASQVYYAPSVLDLKAKIYTVVKSKSRPIDESIFAQNDIEDAFQEDRSNASTSFSLFIDFAQYGQILFIRREEEEEDEEDDVEDKDEGDENEGEEEISECDNENDDDDEDDDGFDDFE